MTRTDVAPGRSKFAVVVAALIGVVSLALGLWEFFAPEPFFEAVATFEPYNEHFVRDLGALTIGVGAVLLLAVATASRGPLLSALLGSGIGAAFHVASHVMDGDFDLGLIFIAVLLLVAAGAAGRRGA